MLATNNFANAVLFNLKKAGRRGETERINKCYTIWALFLSTKLFLTIRKLTEYKKKKTLKSETTFHHQTLDHHSVAMLEAKIHGQTRPELRIRHRAKSMIRARIKSTIKNSVRLRAKLTI